MRSALVCTSTLSRVFVPRLCHSGQTHRFRRCLSAAAGALQYPKTNSRNGKKEELCFTVLYLLKVISINISIFQYTVAAQ